MKKHEQHRIGEYLTKYLSIQKGNFDNRKSKLEFKSTIKRHLTEDVPIMSLFKLVTDLTIEYPEGAAPGYKGYRSNILS